MGLVYKRDEMEALEAVKALICDREEGTQEFF